MVKKKFTNFRPKIRSRHPSHSILRMKYKKLPLLPFKSVIRLGSTTDLPDTITNGGDRIELNTIESIKNSSSKLKMKKCFTANNVKTAKWWTFSNNLFYLNSNLEDEGINIENLEYPIISKSIYGSKGRGNSKHDTAEELIQWLSQCNNVNSYIFERFYNFSKEYRLHVNKDECFYTCRKMLKRDTSQELKWFRNDQNCVWIREDSESNLFDKPINWNEIVEHSIKALNSVGLDFGAVDVKTQSSTNNKGKIRTEIDFIILEINSAPSFGEPGEDTFVSKKYIQEIPRMLKLKYENS